ncbi:MAG: PorT family protein [Treponema sp.]|nr:PorT family protein [Treponema sp.]
MTFLGDDLDSSTQLHDATLNEVQSIDGYEPRPITLEELPESASFPPDEPPDPTFLGGSRYVLTGEYYVDLEDMQHFQLWLWKSNDGSLVYTDELVAEDLEEAMSYMPALVTWVFSRIPVERRVTVLEQAAEIEIDSSGQEYEVINDPLNRWLYLGARAGGSFRFYTLPKLVKDYSSNFTQGFSYEIGLQIGFRFLSFMSIQAEAVFTQDSAPFRGPKFQMLDEEIRYIYYTDTYSSMSLMFPVTVKFPMQFKPFIISPFGGLYLTMPLGQMTIETSDVAENAASGAYEYALTMALGLTLGADFGIQMGPGILFLDLRYNGDLGNTVIQIDSGREYKRSMISFSIGYELALFNKRRRVGVQE